VTAPALGYAPFRSDSIDRLCSEEDVMRAFRSVAILATMLVATGCNNQPAGPLVVRGMNVNGYEFDYEYVAPGSIQADSKDVSISAGKNQIAVTDGKLRVDGRSYGVVKPKDRISVIGGKVSVNGEERKPDS
jgi:hypothetical protein